MIVEALDEAALITDRISRRWRRKRPRSRSLEVAAWLGETTRPPVMSRLFGR